MMEKEFTIHKHTKKRIERWIKGRNKNEFSRRAILDFKRYIQPKKPKKSESNIIEKADAILKREAERTGRSPPFDLLSTYLELASAPEINETAVREHADSLSDENKLTKINVKLPERVFAVLSEIAKKFKVDESHIFDLMLNKKAEEEEHLDEIIKKLRQSE